MIHWSHRGLVDAYFDDRLPPRGRRRLRARLGRCSPCRARYQRHLVLEAAMPGGDERAIDRLWRDIATAGGLRPQPQQPASAANARARASWRARLMVAGAMVGAAVVLLAIIVRPPRRDPRWSIAEPVARGGAAATAALPEIHVFRSVSEHAAEPIGTGPILPRDGLLFAYSNPDPRLTHLMVFAVDEGYAVHWYYPAYQQPGQNPEAVAIVPGTTGMELGEEIRHALRPGPLRIYALFLPAAHRVLEIESMIREVIEEPRRPVTEQARLPLPGSEQATLLLQVAR